MVLLDRFFVILKVFSYKIWVVPSRRAAAVVVASTANSATTVLAGNSRNSCLLRFAASAAVVVVGLPSCVRCRLVRCTRLRNVILRSSFGIWRRASIRFSSERLGIPWIDRR